MIDTILSLCLKWNKNIPKSEYEELQYRIKDIRIYLNNSFIKKFNLDKKYAEKNMVSPTGKTLHEMTCIGFNVMDKIILRIQDLYLDIELAVMKKQIDVLTGKYFRCIVDDIIQETKEWKKNNSINYYE